RPRTLEQWAKRADMGRSSPRLQLNPCFDRRAWSVRNPRGENWQFQLIPISPFFLFLANPIPASPEATSNNDAGSGTTDDACPVKLALTPSMRPVSNIVKSPVPLPLM